MKPRPCTPQILDMDLHPYVGHYIALVEGRIVAVAGTSGGAFARARRSRPKRMPVVIKITHPDPPSQTWRDEETPSPSP